MDTTRWFGALSSAVLLTLASASCTSEADEAITPDAADAAPDGSSPADGGASEDSAATDGPSPSPDAATDGGAAVPATGPLPGSYDFTGKSGPCSPYTGPWYYGTSFRLDVINDSSGIRAIVWGGAGLAFSGETKYDPEYQGDGWILGPLMLFASGIWSFSLDENRAPNVVHAQTSAGEECFQNNSKQACFSGQVVADATAPSFAVPGTNPLPWTDRVLVASEGVRATEWMARVHATMAGSAVAVEPVPVPGSDYVNQLRLTLPWSQRVAKSVHIELADGVPDPGGRPGKGLTADLQYLDIGAAVPAILFDGSANPVLWGFSLKPAGDPSCEGDLPCAAAHYPGTSTIVGRVAMGPSTTIEANLHLANVSEFKDDPILISLQAIGPSGESVSAELVGPVTDAGGAKTLSVEVPAGWGEVGVVLQAGSKEACGTHYDISVQSMSPI